MNLTVLHLIRGEKTKLRLFIPSPFYRNGKCDNFLCNIKTTIAVRAGTNIIFNVLNITINTLLIFLNFFEKGANNQSKYDAVQVVLPYA